MCDLALQAILRPVVVAKLLFASSAWWGFTNVSDRQRVDTFLRRSIRCGYCPLNLSQFVEQCKAADDQLFKNILVDTNHVLFTLLPPCAVAVQNYDLRPRPHNLQLPEHSGRLMDSNFITRMLYTDVY